MSDILWPLLALVLAGIVVYLLALWRAEQRAGWARCVACGERAPSWRMIGVSCRSCVLDTQQAVRLSDLDRPDPDEDVPPAFRGIL